MTQLGKLMSPVKDECWAFVRVYLCLCVHVYGIRVSAYTFKWLVSSPLVHTASVTDKRLAVKGSEQWICHFPLLWFSMYCCVIHSLKENCCPTNYQFFFFLFFPVRLQEHYQCVWMKSSQTLFFTQWLCSFSVRFSQRRQRVWVQRSQRLGMLLLCLTLWRVPQPASCVNSYCRYV